MDDEEGGYGWDGYVIRYDQVHPMSDGERAYAAAVADAAAEPARPEDIVKELGRLRLLTASRDVGTDLDLVLAAYTHELQRYPIDAIREVLRTIGRTQRFWPTMSELEERLGRLVRPRNELRQAMNRPYEVPKASPDWTPRPTDEEKQAVLDLLARHGILFDAEGRMHPMEEEPVSKKDLRRVQDETSRFRLPDESDPRVQARLRQMGV